MNVKMDVKQELKQDVKQERQEALVVKIPKDKIFVSDKLQVETGYHNGKKRIGGERRLKPFEFVDDALLLPTINSKDTPTKIRTKWVSSLANMQIGRMMRREKNWQTWSYEQEEEIVKRGGYGIVDGKPAGSVAAAQKKRYERCICAWCGSETWCLPGKYENAMCPVCETIYKRAAQQMSQVIGLITDKLIKLSILVKVPKDKYDFVHAEYIRLVDDAPLRAVNFGKNYYVADIRKIDMSVHSMLYNRSYLENEILGPRGTELVQYYWRTSLMGFHSFDRACTLKILLDMYK